MEAWMDERPAMKACGQHRVLRSSVATKATRRPVRPPAARLARGTPTGNITVTRFGCCVVFINLYSPVHL